MDGILEIGPLKIATDRGVAIALFWAFLTIGAVIGRRIGTGTQTGAGRVAWIALIVGLIAGRLGFIIANADAFAAEPASAIAIWQGGFSLWAGVAAAAVVIAVMLRRGPAARWMGGALAGLVAVQLLAAYLLAPAPRPLPRDLIVADMAMRPIPIDSLRGRPVVLNLWATWCPPCRREMPMMVDVASGSAIPILLVNQGEDAEQVRRYLMQGGLPEGAVRLDPRGLMMDRLAVRAIPTTLFIDANGVIRRTHVGEISRAMLTSAMRDLEKTT